MAEPEPIPAATLIVMRDGVPAPELLMVERARTMSFAGGALVFPGGRVDPGDRVTAAALGGDVEEVASQVAAVRETLEEAGIAVGVETSAAALPELRRRLYAGEAMATLLGELGGALRLAALVPFARWVPKGVSHKVFDTRFYLARAPEDADPVVDGNENVRVFWASARAVLDSADRGAAAILYPTRRNLERLARFADFAHAVGDARRYPVRTITPWTEVRDGVEQLCIPEGAGYPVTAEPLAGALRA